MKARVRKFALIQRVGKPPRKKKAELHFRVNRGRHGQLTTACRTTWPAPKVIHVEVHTGKTEGNILVNLVHVANYSIHDYRSGNRPALSSSALIEVEQ